MCIRDRTTPSTAHMFALESYVSCTKTPYQQVEIVDNPLYGRMLILDGKIQSAEMCIRDRDNTAPLP